METPKPASALILQERIFLACVGVFVSALVTCNLIFQKFFYIDLGFYMFEISVGILPYPITFLVTDIVSEIYGRKRADQLVITGFIASVFMIFIILVAQAVPATPWSPVGNDMFNSVFGLSPAAVFASMVAYLSAQFIDVRLFHFWKRLTKGKHLWLRNNASTITSQFIDTSVVISLLCIAGVIAWEQWFTLVLNGFLFKVMIAILDTPLFYMLNYWLRRWMHLKWNEEISEQQTLA